MVSALVGQASWRLSVLLPAALEREPRLELDAAIVGNGALTTTASALEAAAAEAGIHQGRLAELGRTQHTLIAARIEVVEHVRHAHAKSDVVAVIGGLVAPKAASASSSAAPATTATWSTSAAWSATAAQSTSRESARTATPRTAALRTACAIGPVAAASGTETEDAVDAHVDGHHSRHGQVIPWHEIA